MKVKTIPIAPIIVSSLLSANAIANQESKGVITDIQTAAITASENEIPAMNLDSKDVITDIQTAAIASSENKIPTMNLAPLPTKKASRVVFIRGFSSLDTQATKSSAVTINHDDVYMGRTVGLAADVADLEDVIYSRGPTTDSGRNALAGSVNYISVKPKDEFEVSKNFPSVVKMH